MLKKPDNVRGRWQKIIVKMPKESSRYFPPSQIRTEMLSFYRAAKTMGRNPCQQNEGSGVRVFLDAKEVQS